MMHRIFLAINLPEDIKTKLLEYKKSWPELPLRWMPLNNLHVTLLFFGNISDKELENIKRITREVAANHKPFSFSLTKIIYGPKDNEPKMIWAKGEATEELLALQKDLAKSLEYKEEYPFSLHITLARLNAWEFKKIELEERPQVNKDIALKIPVSSFEIMESKLKRIGAEYSIVESIPLKT